jgi:hypothetical protein
MKHIRKLIHIGFLLVFTAPAPLFCAPTFTIAGEVHDAGDARIPKAHVTAMNSEAGVTVQTDTDAQGEFHLEVPSAGTYQVQVAADGFKTLSASAVLTKDSPDAYLHLTLELSSHTETVEVTADALSAETTSTQLGETLDAKKMESVPLNGRSFTDLMAVQPGIVPQNTAQPGAVIMTGVATTPPSGNANPGNLSISGQREDSNGFRVNGSDVEEDVNMGTSIVPNLDSIDSFRVLTSNFDAEYGNSSGGQVLVVTKSGTAQLHGSAFEFLRNTALDARNYFSAETSSAAPSVAHPSTKKIWPSSAITRARASQKASTPATSPFPRWPSAPATSAPGTPIRPHSPATSAARILLQSSPQS